MFGVLCNLLCGDCCLSSIGCCLLVLVFVACGVPLFVVCCLALVVAMLFVAVNRRWLLFVGTADVNVVRCFVVAVAVGCRVLFVV